MSNLHSVLASLNHGLNSVNLETSVRNTELSLRIVHLLYGIGLISHYFRTRDKNSLYSRNLRFKYYFDKSIKIRVFFRYNSYAPNAQIIMISRPGHRKYVTRHQLYILLFKKKAPHLFFLSTTAGIISASTALSYNLGGELLFRIRY